MNALWEVGLMLSLTRSGRVVVVHPSTGVVHSSHYEEREAIESAVNLSLRLAQNVEVRYDITVDVDTGGVQAIEEPLKPALTGVAPYGNTLQSHPPVKPGKPTVYATMHSASGDGSLESPLSLDDAMSQAAPGDVIRIVPGTYRVKSRILRTARWEEPVLVDARDVVFDAMPDENDPVPDGLRVLQLAGTREIWHGLTIYGGHRGVYMDGYQNMLSKTLVENTLDAGVYIFGDAFENELRDVRVRNVGDPTITGTNVADGIALTANRGNLTAGHTLVRVLVENAPDDGIDLFRAADCDLRAIAVLNAGYHHTQGDVGGDGGGIKLGGSEGSGENSVSGAIVVNAKGEAIKANSAPLPVHIEYATVVGYGQIAFNSFIVAGSSLRACIAAGGNYPYTGTANREANSWSIHDDAISDLHDDYSVRADSPLATLLDGGPIGATDEALALLKQ